MTDHPNEAALIAHVEMFGERDTYLQLSQQFEMSKSTVHNILRSAGLNYGRRGAVTCAGVVSLADAPEWVTQ